MEEKQTQNNTKDEFFYRIEKVYERESFYEKFNICLNKEKIYEITNFNDNFVIENDLQLAQAREKYLDVMHQKVQSDVIENFIIHIDVNPTDFYNKHDLKKFAEHTYKVFNKYLNVLYFVVYKSLGETFIRAFCNCVVKYVFLEHTLKRLEKQRYKIKDIQGCLSYNVILGGNMNENPLGRFYTMLIEDLNKLGYNLVKGQGSFLEQNFRDKLDELSIDYMNLITDITCLLKTVKKDDIEMYNKIKNIIIAKDLKFSINED